MEYIIKEKWQYQLWNFTNVYIQQILLLECMTKGCVHHHDVYGKVVAPKTDEILGEGSKKKIGKKYGLLPNPGGGGVSEGGQKTKLLFWKKVFFREYLESF